MRSSSAFISARKVLALTRSAVWMQTCLVRWLPASCDINVYFLRAKGFMSAVRQLLIASGVPER
jgi:hypothetical protein